MNNLIKEQLNLVRIAQLPDYTDDTTHLVIEKHSKSDNDLIAGKYYLIELEDYILHPPANFTLHENWNNNIIPRDKCMKVEISQLMGKMVKINGVGYDNVNKVDLNTTWAGWVPRSSLIIIKEI